MIAKITRGADVGGLIHYLLGPTRDPGNVHEDQRVIAASDGLVYGRDAAHAAGMSEERFIALQMDAPRLEAGVEVSKGHVWHLSLTNAAGDRVLDDDQWAAIARHTLEELGFDHPDRAPTPWVAIRHGHSAAGNEHVHIAVSLVREDGTVASPWHDRKKVSAVCAEMEQRYGLRVVEGRSAGSGPGPSRPEIDKAAAAGLAETPRERLARAVRATAAASKDEAEFVRRMRSEGFAVRPRYAEGGTSRVVGYSVADPRGPGAGDTPLWFGGGRLGRDLTLPALRENWTAVEDQGAAWAPASSATPTTAGPAPVEALETRPMSPAALERATDRVRDATDALAAVAPDDRAAWAAAAHRAAGATAALARRVEDEPGPLSATADLLARSAQAGRRDPVMAERLARLSGVATVATQASVMVHGAGSQTAAWWMLTAELARLAQAIERAHQARGELQRAGQIAAQLRAVTATGPPTGPSTSSTLARTRTATRDHGGYDRG